MIDPNLRRRIKHAIDRLPAERLASLADYVEFLGRRALERRIAAAEKDLKVGRGTNWRKVRKDV